MEGYHKMAQLMADYDEFNIIRRFRALNIQNLLYLQAEIVHLEEDLMELANRDTKNPARQYHGRDWWSLANGESDGDREQWQKVLELRAKLDIYNDAALKQAQLSRLDRPSCHDIEFLRTWLERPTMGNFPLVGLDRNTWSSIYENDLMAVRTRPSSDYLSDWITHTIVPSFHRMVGEKYKVCICTKSNRTQLR